MTPTARISKPLKSGVDAVAHAHYHAIPTVETDHAEIVARDEHWPIFRSASGLAD